MKINNEQHVTRTGLVKRNPVKTRAQQNAIYEKVILDAIDTEGYESEFTQGMNLKTPKGKLQFLKKRFESEYGHMISRVGQQNAMAEWYQGLAIDLPFYNWDIIKLARRAGSLPKNSTDAQDQKILDNYWNFMANKTFQLFRKYGVN